MIIYTHGIKIAQANFYMDNDIYHMNIIFLTILKTKLKSDYSIYVNMFLLLYYITDKFTNVVVYTI